MKSRLLNNWSDLLSILLVGFYVLISLNNIQFPGVHYDEIFYGNAALGVIDPSTFIESHFHGIPILIIPYIGALKSYIFFPIFKIFGVSPLTIRFPVIFIVAISLLLLYRTLKVQFNSKIALTSILLISIDPSFIAHSRTDFGPVVLSFFFRVLAMYLFTRYTKSKQNRYLLFLLFTFVLGFFNKMDFIWFIVAFSTSCLLFFSANIKSLLVSKRIQIYIGTLGILCISVVFYLFKKFNFFTAIQLPTLKHINKVISEYINLINGTSFYTYMIGEIKSVNGQIYLVAIVLLIIFSLTFSWKTLSKKYSKQIFFYTSILLLILIQIIFTSRAEASWHVFMTYPFTSIIIAFAFNEAWTIHKDILIKSALILVLILVGGYNISLLNQYISGSRGTLNNITWSPAIYKLIDYTKSKDAYFVSVDWGIHNQLLVFNPIKNKYTDRWLQLINKDFAEESIISLIKEKSDKPIYFILHSQDKAVFPQAQTKFISISKKNKLALTQDSEIKDKKSSIFVLYKLDKP